MNNNEYVAGVIECSEHNKDGQFLQKSLIRIKASADIIRDDIELKNV